MKPMLPVLMDELPVGIEWNYEVKYDGFRGILSWTGEEIVLTSRNGRSLQFQFPEIISYLESLLPAASDFLPMRLDGEIAILNNPFQANFRLIQSRGRMKSPERIAEQAIKRPAVFLAFDLLELKGRNLTSLPYTKRKEMLCRLFSDLEVPKSPHPGFNSRIQLIPSASEALPLWNTVSNYQGEGIVAKTSHGYWEEGKRTGQWMKVKNWNSVSCFITAFDETNSYYEVAVYKEEKPAVIGSFLFSLDPASKQALNETIRRNAYGKHGGKWLIKPALCVELHYLEWMDGQMREPHFHRFLFDMAPEDCTWEALLRGEAFRPGEIDITHHDKVLWAGPKISKLEFALYMRSIYPYMIPFLKDRILTVIRYPHGLAGEAFYQKNCPDYAPDFIQTFHEDEIHYIVCNDLTSLLWLANQSALEYHIPFATAGSSFVSEIVFDLDPPSRSEFQLAVTAARILKQAFDNLALLSFVKTSGNKGLQVYVPLPEGCFTWDDTRKFTSFIADFLVQTEPELFTVERLKKNRKGRLYVDFVQHAKGKTIIAPYSPRGNNEALIATPLFWEEVNEELSPYHFTMKTIMDRIKKKGDPFAAFHLSKKLQPFHQVLELL